MSAKIKNLKGKVKFIRPDGQGYIVPDQYKTTKYPFGRNAMFDSSSLEDGLSARDIQVGDRVSFDALVLANDEVLATNVKKVA